MLLERLQGWEPEFPVGVRPWKPRWTKCYRIDLAEPNLMLAVEVDGHSHRCPEQKKRHRRKRLYLRCKGWTVLRFSNERMRQNVEGVVAEIAEVSRSLTSKQEPPTTSPMDS